MDKREFPFNFMKKNYRLASQDENKGFKSEHWETFPEGYESLIDRKDIWPRMLRNALSLGFNDSLIGISNKRFDDGQGDLWKKMKGGNFPDLIGDTGFSEKKITGRLSSLFRGLDNEFVLNNFIGDTGTPRVALVNIKTDEGKTCKFRFNLHDTDDIYHSWFILNQLKHIKSSKPVICEIGAGYGGVATKIKRNIPKSKIIIFDLPEVNVAQSYYLSQEFKESKFFGYRDFKEKGRSILTEDFDFLVLPGWSINELLTENSVDAYINIRSMMEMNLETIEFYFQAIQRTLKINGIFACINRYAKSVGMAGKYVNNFFKNYPFDKNWSPLYSSPSEIQPHIHFLIAKRENQPPIFPFKEILGTIRPNAFL